MLKLTYCLRRLPNLSHEEFLDYWLNNHGPLVKSHREALRIVKYVQNHASPQPDLHDPIRGAEAEDYDGIAELWWDAKEDILAALETEEGRKAGRSLLEDEKKFIDIARSPLWYNLEQVIFG